MMETIVWNRSHLHVNQPMHNNGACPNGEANAPMPALVPASDFGKLSAANLQQVQYAHAAVGEVGGLSLALTIDRAWLELWQEYHKGVPFTLTAFAS